MSEHQTSSKNSHLEIISGYQVFNSTQKVPEGKIVRQSSYAPKRSIALGEL